MDQYLNYLGRHYFRNNIASLLQDNEIKVLYHYTSANALKNIIKEKRIWFSDIHYLNDKSELTYTFDMLYRILNQETKLNKKFKEHLKIYMDIHIYGKPLKVIKIPRQNIFVASFSQAPDELSLWNYYTKSDKKFGYNIGFKIDTFMKNKLQNFYCGKVIYDTNEQEEQIKKALFDYQNIYIKYDNDDERESIVSTFIDFIELTALFFKHEAFASEREYRNVYIINENNNPFQIEYRIHNGIFIPYIEIEFTIDKIESVTASPLIDIKLGDGVNQFFRSHKMKIKLNASKIPIRY